MQLRSPFASKSTADVQHWWNTRPCNVHHSDAPHDSLRYSREVTNDRYLREPHNLTFMQVWRWANKMVLEVGCGIGTDTITLARHGAFVVGTDISERSLEIARQRVQAEDLDYRVNLIHHDIEQPLAYIVMPPRLIYSYGVLHHTPNPDIALRNLWHVADQETELRIMLYHRWSTKGTRLGLTNKRIARGSEARSNSPVTYAYGRRGARQLLKRNGWEVTHMNVDHIFIYRADRLPHHVVAFPWKHIDPVVIDIIKHLLGWHLLIVARPMKELPK